MLVRKFHLYMCRFPLRGFDVGDPGLNHRRRGRDPDQRATASAGFPKWRVRN